jgi:hypothetical protein
VVRHAPVSWIPESALQWLPGPESGGGSEPVAVTKEYVHEGVEMIGGFARVEFGGVLAGVQIPKAAAYLTARELLNNLIGVAFLLLTAAVVVGLLWSRLITRSIERLSAATRVVAKETLISSFLTVRATRSGPRGIIQPDGLGLKVREHALKQAQAALIQSEKMAAFGQLGAGLRMKSKTRSREFWGMRNLRYERSAKRKPPINTSRSSKKKRGVARPSLRACCDSRGRSRPSTRSSI